MIQKKIPLGKQVLNIFKRPKSKKKDIIGFLDEYDGSFLTGWAYSHKNSGPVQLALLIDGKKKIEFLADQYREDLFLNGINEGKAAFKVALDVKEFLQNSEKEEINIELVCNNENKEKIKNNIIAINTKQEIKFHIDTQDYENISGWITDVNNQNIMIRLDIWVDSKIVKTILANQPRPDLRNMVPVNYYHGFNINLSDIVSDKKYVEVKISYNYGEEVVILPCTYFLSLQTITSALTDLQTYLREKGYENGKSEAVYLTKLLLPEVIDHYRQSKTTRQSILNSMPKINNKVTVIIPVYKGIQETINCLYSVINSKNKNKFDLIVISDCAPEPQMEVELKNLKKEHKFQLFFNEINLGFVATINKGIELAQTRDVILLNSDTVVANYWLDNLHTVAYSNIAIGTVTPMSNNATICSFPGFCVDNELPKDYQVHELAEFCSTNQSKEIDLPTAHGYCMYIKRQVLDEIGLFDVQKWGKGYAEENDFSLRASKLGWRNVMTNKTFVHHLGSVSFAEDTEGFIEKNLQKLNSIYPDYPLLVQTFIKQDPARLLRNELAEKLLVEELKHFDFTSPATGKSILFISLTLGGGTKVATDYFAKRLHKENQAVFYLTPLKKGSFWRVASTESNVYADYDAIAELNELIQLLKKINIWHIHYHNTIGFKKDIWVLPEKLGCQYDITVHDYYAICPRVNFVSVNDQYCSELGVAQCQKCLSVMGEHTSSELSLSDFNDDIQEWRNFFYERFKHARLVFVPSKDTQARVLKYFNLDNVIHHYHPEESKRLSLQKPLKKIGETLNIGFIGAIGVHKGLNIIKDLALEIDEKKLPINLKIIGYTSDDEALKKFKFVSITGKFENQEIPGLVQENKIDVFFLTSIWPETYSYTFSEVLEAGKFPIYFRIGAVMERADKYKIGCGLNLDSSRADLLQEIIKYVRKEGNKCIEIKTTHEDILTGYYHFHA